MDITQPPLLYVVIALAVLIVGLIVFSVAQSAQRKRERARLQERYGSEFDRTVESHRSTRAAVEDLKEREQLHDHLSVHDLNEADLVMVRKHMAMAQYRFVEDPADALRRTEDVLTEVLRAKGYPMDDREQAGRLFSVDHPEHAQTLRTALDSSQPTTDVEQLRKRFLDARKTIAEVAGTTFSPVDAVELNASNDDLRIERSVEAPASAGTHRTPFR